MPYVLTFLFCLMLAFPAHAVVWKPALDNAPDLHTTGVEITVQFKAPIPEKVLLAVTSMDKSVWQAELVPHGQSKLTATLAPGDFKNIKPGEPPNPMRFWYMTEFALTLDGKKDDGIAVEAVKWIRDDKTVFPWETDPAPVAKEKGLTFWPGVGKNNGGHFAWRYEPNGLLINNVSFNCIERSWYYFKPGRNNESFQFNFRIPGAVEPKITVVEKKDTDKKTGDVINRAGIDRQTEYLVDKGIYANDAVAADWTSFRWRRNVKTQTGRHYFQELRYSILAVGIQVETDAPSFLLSFQDGKKEKGPAGIVLPEKEKLRVVPYGQEIRPAAMAKNWLVLLANDGTPEIPVVVVFQHRPDRLEWTTEGLVVHRRGGIGTLALGTPLGAGHLAPDTLAQWAQSPDTIPADQLRQGANLLAAYPFKCQETFAVANGYVTIRDQIAFLPWSDDWKTKVQPYSPLPPLVAYAARKGYIPQSCIGDVADLKIVTKWGPYLARKGTRVDYKLPIPDAWDLFPLAVKPTAETQHVYNSLNNTLSPKEVEVRFSGAMTPTNLGPSQFPHYAAHDFSVGGWRAANFMPDDLRQRYRLLTSHNVLGALFPANYRYRRDPITGASYVAGTIWGAPEYDINGEGAGDIDYWQGLTLYGLYSHAKYAGMWDTMAKYWPTIRSMYSYWEALHSWALMSPGAREAGELYHGDMPTGGYAGLVGFYFLSEHLGTPYQHDLAAYLLAKAAVPMAAKWGFRDWAAQLDHQELRGGGRCSGFGERFVASFPSVSANCRNFEPADPWWRTGCIGPQSAQPETMDLYLKGCPRDIADWETDFIRVCPTEQFKTHDDVRTMPHVMLRTYLDGTFRPAAFDLFATPRDAYQLRDAHVLATLVAWNCPVRLVDWAPAYIQHAAWDKQTGATIRLEAPAGGAKIKMTVHDRLETPHFTLDGNAVTATAGKKWEEWTLFTVAIPAGSHELKVK